MTAVTIPQALQIAESQLQSHRTEQAASICQQILQQDPRNAQALNLLGLCRLRMGRHDEARELTARAVQLQPGYAEALHNLGLACIGSNRTDEALAAFRRAAQVRPNFAEALANAAGLLRNEGLVDEALDLYRRAVTLRPDLNVVHSNFIYAMHLAPSCDGRIIYNEHLNWAKVHAARHLPRIAPHENDRDPGRALRVGYASPDFRDHPVGRFMLPLLRRHDRTQFQVHCFSDAHTPDAMTQTIGSTADVSHDTSSLSHEQLAALVRTLRIDILVDLAGHTARNRMLAFALKPAPIQITYLGYPGTTGLATMDYRITDALADPIGTADTLHTEKLIRLEDGFLCYEAPTSAPEIGDLPAGRTGHITFGCFSNFSKVTPPLMMSWGRILAALPTARLVVKSSTLVDPATRARVQDLLVRHTVPADRVSILGPTDAHHDHLASYNQIDIALDTFPYNGTTTTCEALFMGVPMITLCGNRHASRVGLDILTRVGLPELIAESHQQYEQAAVNLTQDLPKLAELRRTLRSRMQSSFLMNPEQLTNQLENAYRAAWKSWCGA